MKTKTVAARKKTAGKKGVQFNACGTFFVCIGSCFFIEFVERRRQH
jgi:hypothetical protein